MTNLCKTVDNLHKKWYNKGVVDNYSIVIPKKRLSRKEKKMETNKKVELTSRVMERENERIVDMSAMYIVACFNPRIPEDALTTLADTLEKSCRNFFHAMRANGQEHVRITVDSGKTSGKISEVIPEASQRTRFLAMSGVLLVNAHSYMSSDIVAELYGLGNGTAMASFIPELCRPDGHMKVERGKILFRDMLKMINNFHYPV